MKKLITAALLVSASPALAASTNPFSGEFWTLHNTNLIVWLAFLLFIGILAYYKVPAMIGGMLDKRAQGIKADLDEAKALREEAQTLLASYERKQKEVKVQAERIVATAKEEASKAAEQAKLDIATSVERRLASAEDQIESAQAAAIKEIRDQAVTVAIQVAREIIAAQMTAADSNKLIDEAITTVETKLH